MTENSQTIPGSALADSLQKVLDSLILESGDRFGMTDLVVEPAQIATVLLKLRNHPATAFDQLVDVVGIDTLPLKRPLRFEVVYLLKSITLGHRLMVRSRMSAQLPHCASAAGVYAIADWLEREVFDQFGIVFDGHPNLRRLLNHKDFDGHPLRKDYPVDKRQDFTVSDDLLDEMRMRLDRLGLKAASLNIQEFQHPGTTGRGTAPGDNDEDPFLVNLGPSHPIVHGILRLLLAVDGETIVAAVPEIGYLHRGAEKSIEAGNYHQVIPFTDRLNYASPVSNNIGYCKAVEKMLGIMISERDRLLRVVLLEINRIMDHLLCTGPHLIDLGALTPFWYLFQVREKFYDILEKYSGARLTYSCVRIGSMPFTLYPGFADEVEAVLKELGPAIDEVRGLVERNRIFYDRCNGVGAISRADAIRYGMTGPCLRATGLEYDLRKAEPYYGYEEFDFSVVTGTSGDTYDRFFIRIYEMIESVKIVRQALIRLASLPPDLPVEGAKKSKGFKKVAPPAGEVYDSTEAPNGELGFYIVSDGTANPYRLKIRAPSLCNYAAIEPLVQGSMIADMVAVIGSINVIGGEIDR